MGVLTDLVNRQKAEQKQDDWRVQLEKMSREAYEQETQEKYKQKYEARAKQKQNKILSPSEVLSRNKKIARFRKEYQEHRYPRTARLKKTISSALANKSFSRKVSGMLQRNFAPNQPRQRIIYRRQPRRRIPQHLRQYQFQRRQAPQFTQSYPNQAERELAFQRLQNDRLQRRIDVYSPATIQQTQRALMEKQREHVILRDSQQRFNLMKARFLTLDEIGFNPAGSIPRAEPLNFGDGGLLKIKFPKMNFPFW